MFYFTCNHGLSLWKMPLQRHWRDSVTLVLALLTTIIIIIIVCWLAGKRRHTQQERASHSVNGTVNGPRTAMFIIRTPHLVIHSAKLFRLRDIQCATVVVSDFKCLSLAASGDQALRRLFIDLRLSDNKLNSTSGVYQQTLLKVVTHRLQTTNYNFCYVWHMLFWYQFLPLINPIGLELAVM